MAFDTVLRREEATGKNRNEETHNINDNEWKISKTVFDRLPIIDSMRFPCGSLLFQDDILYSLDRMSQDVILFSVSEGFL